MINEKYEYEISPKIAARIADLADRLYNFIPDVCWMTEANLAKALNVSMRQIKYAKAYLESINKIQIELRQNGKRANLIHTLIKAFPISQNSLDELSDEDISINWSLFDKLSARELNDLPLEDKLNVYEQMRLPFIPLHYPKFNKNDVVFCSCSRGQRCNSIGKHPITTYKELDFSDEFTLRQMKSFWVEDNHIDNVDCNNSYNIGFKTDEFIVIDIDYRNGGAYSLELLEEIYGELPRNLTVKTGNGIHIYARSNKPIKTGVEILGFQGIDIRSKGNFIVAPFSDHKSGTQYEWLSISKPESLPKDLIADLTENDNQTNSVKTGKKIDNNSTLPKRGDNDFTRSRGARNSTLFRLAGRERRNGAEQAEIFNYLMQVNSKHCIPPLDEREVLGISKSIMKYLPKYDKFRLGQKVANI